jgi:hypothetical protein
MSDLYRSTAVDRPWISTVSFAVILLALFRALEVLANVATISLAMRALPFSIALFLGVTLGSKLIMTLVCIIAFPQAFNRRTI